ncbi:hypothetical protein EGM87_14690 [Sphingobium sp. RSMS]|uniref:hypothetical protein n=1 Tax=Sphingobium sp. RSMS TaxID=520734 RepID=UPI0010FA0B45|nr:hypothetical protein [Sphingobium sp. RSMS]UXC90281.1 hypothetical protein EGM87_14690 [Sphingobium sp. RSMS]
MSSYNSIFFGQPFGRGTKVAYSAAWYERFRKEGLRLNGMYEETVFEDDPTWLMLPLSRRQVALQRLEVMLDYERHESPGDLEAENAAQRLGVTTGQFYRIRRQWKRSRSVFDLLPYGKPGAARRPKLDQDVSDVLGKLIMKAVATDGMRAPKDIMKAVQEQWPLNKPIPSHMTLRKNIAHAIEELTNVSGGLVLVNSTIPQGAFETATGYGEVVAVDHIGLQVFVATEGGPIAPIVTFAIDLFTSSICGVHLSFGAPGPLQFEAVLRDVQRRSEQAARLPLVVKPRLIFEAGGSSGWPQLMSRMAKNFHHANIRRSQRLNFGETIIGLIGSSIGNVNFSSRKYLNDLVFNPGKDALISFDELQKLIERGLRGLNDKRIPPGAEIFHLKFDFLDASVS